MTGRWSKCLSGTLLARSFFLGSLSVASWSWGEERQPGAVAQKSSQVGRSSEEICTNTRDAIVRLREEVQRSCGPDCERRLELELRPSSLGIRANAQVLERDQVLFERTIEAETCETLFDAVDLTVELFLEGEQRSAVPCIEPGTSRFEEGAVWPGPDIDPFDGVTREPAGARPEPVPLPSKGLLTVGPFVDSSWQRSALIGSNIAFRVGLGDSTYVRTSVEFIGFPPSTPRYPTEPVLNVLSLALGVGQWVWIAEGWELGIDGGFRASLVELQSASAAVVRPDFKGGLALVTNALVAKQWASGLRVGLQIGSALALAPARLPPHVVGGPPSWIQPTLGAVGGLFFGVRAW